MKILLTGAAGFIGSHTMRALLARGDEVLGIDNFNDYYDPSIKKKNIEDFSDSVMREDILNKEKTNRIFSDFKPDILLHLAARAGVRPSIENPELYHRVNVEGTVNLLEAAKKNGTGRVVFASSSSVYGNQSKTPFSEEDLTEFPISPYAVTKRTAENICYTYSKVHGIKATCLRFFTVYGPSGRPDMAPYLFTKAVDEGLAINKFGSGLSKRDYTYIDDIVSGILSACDKSFDYEIINLGNNKPVELNYFISLVEKLLGKKAIVNELPVQSGDVDITYANIEKAQRLLGYKPKTTIEEGMERFINWYQSQR